MSKEKKHLIIITFQPLTKFISERFGLKVKKRNWNKKYLYILPLLNKNYLINSKIQDLEMLKIKIFIQFNLSLRYLIT